MLNIDRFSGRPIYEQVVEQMQKLIVTGAVGPGEQIPSVRALSIELSVNPNTIQKAYNELEQRQITYSVPGVGRFVSDGAGARIRQYYLGRLPRIRAAAADFAVAGVPEEAVVEAVRQAYENIRPHRGKKGAP